MIETHSKQLNTFQVWAISIGMVISGQYFGWDYCLRGNSIIDIIVALIFVTIFYGLFMFVYTKLAIHSPTSGGIMAYIEAIQKPRLAFISGTIALIEFFFAVAAISISIGAYLHQLLPHIPIKTLTYTCLALIIIINIKGLSVSVTLEIITTMLALTGLIIYSYSIANQHELTVLRAQIHTTDTLHIFTAIPYLLWLFLGIEGSVLTSKECTTPQTTLPKAIKLAMITLTMIAILTVVQTAIMLPQQLHMDDPLPSLLTLTHKPTWMVILISLLGACGLLASLNGLMIAASRQLHGLVERVLATKVLSQAESRKITSQCTALLGILSAVTINIIPESQLLYISIMAAICIYILGSVTYIYNKRLDNTSFNLSIGISIYVLLTGILLLILMIKKT